jgi:release factor glutamine methyltransferase
LKELRVKTELARLAREALATSEFKAFGDALATQALPDSFGVLADSDLVALVAEQLQDDDPTKWLTRPLTWNAGLYDPHVTLSSADKLLHLLWQDLSTRLARKLDAVSHRTSLSPRGAVLCFFGRAQFSIVVEYTRSGGGAVGLRPLAALPDPNGVLELTNLLDEATAEVRNAIKNAAMSVDKLVFQRGSIIHVDRQREDVFGPTIDTVILGELLAEWLDLKTPGSKISALEVGPGSGLLSAILASSDHVGDLTSVDLNGSAVSCTLKNLQINDVTLDAKHQRVRIRAEKFDSDQFTAPFDFVVCNPPYIPSAPDSASLAMREYGRAVGGLELSMDILKSLPTLLSPEGVLLLMASSLSDSEIIATVPEGFEAVAALGGDGRRVPLDVDVVWQRADWRERLLADQRIEQDEDGGLWHKLRPLWIKRTGRT